MSGLHFRFMALWIRLRDLFAAPARKLREAGIRRGDRVLDYGCGPGGYSLAAAQLVGETGKVYALDVHPLAVRMVARAAAKKGLANVEAILSDCATGLESGSVDAALLYDVFHMLSDPDAVLKELHRVLKAGGLLSFSDDHMAEEDITEKVTRGGFFSLSSRGKRTYTFSQRRAQSTSFPT